eukprot:Rmarinus@m.28826
MLELIVVLVVRGLEDIHETLASRSVVRNGRLGATAAGTVEVAISIEVAITAARDNREAGGSVKALLVGAIGELSEELITVGNEFRDDHVKVLLGHGTVHNFRGGSETNAGGFVNKSVDRILLRGVLDNIEDEGRVLDIMFLHDERATRAESAVGRRGLAGLITRIPAWGSEVGLEVTDAEGPDAIRNEVRHAVPGRVTAVEERVAHVLAIEVKSIAVHVENGAKSREDVHRVHHSIRDGTRLNHVGPSDGSGHTDTTFHALELASTKDAVVATLDIILEVRAVIGGEDNDSVLPEAELLESMVDLANRPVHLGHHVSERRAVKLLVGTLVTGVGIHGTVHLKVGQVHVEGLIHFGVALKEFKGLVSEAISRLPEADGLLDDLLVFVKDATNHTAVAVSATMVVSVRVAKVIVVALAGREEGSVVVSKLVHPKMPFPNVVGGIALLLHLLGNRNLAHCKAGGDSRVLQHGNGITDHTSTDGQATSLESSTARGASGLGVPLSKPHTILHHLSKIRSLIVENALNIIGGEITITQIIGKHDQDIGPHLRLPTKGSAVPHQAKEQTNNRYPR